MKRALGSSLLLLAVAGCPAPAAVTVTRNFNRPSDVTIVCLELPVLSDGRLALDQVTGTGRGAIVPKAQNDCPQTTVDLDISDPGNQSDNPPIYRGRRNFALVSQTDRSEVAVVNLNPRNGDVVLFDNDHQIPGYTFIPVGRLPTRLVPSTDGRVTFVCTTGEPSITVLDNSRVLGLTNYRLRAPDASAPVSIALSGNPSDVALQRRNNLDLLYVAIPSRGAVEVWDVTDPTNPSRRSIVTLRGGSPTMPMDGGVPDGGADASLEAGDAGAVDGQSDASTGEAGTSARGAMPFQLALSPATDGVLYVSDRNQNFIHVLAPGADGLPVEGEPLQVGTGTTVLTASPVLVEGATTSQYLYAVDADDGTLLAVDVNARAVVRANTVRALTACRDATFDANRCAKIEPLLPFDRVPVLGRVASVAFLNRDAVSTTDCRTPIAPPATDTLYTPSPLVLRGVQAVVGTEDGRGMFIDLLDPDFAEQPDRSGTDVPQHFQRHLPRSSSTYQYAVALLAQPTLNFNGAGVSFAPDLPSLVDPNSTGPACTASSASPTACTVSNNWCVQLTPTSREDGTSDATHADTIANRGQAWAVTFEGILPGYTMWYGPAVTPNPTVPDEYTLDAPSGQFCTRGTLDGDRLVLPEVSPLTNDYVALDGGPRVPPPNTQDTTCTATLCNDFFGTTQTPCNREFEIVEASQGRLRLRLPRTAQPGGGLGYGDPLCGRSLGTDPARLRSALACCYPESTRYEVRAANSWVVVGSRQGYQHNVVADSAGRCVQGPTFPTGRAFSDATYDALTFRFRIQSGCTTDPATGRTSVARAQRNHTFLWGVANGYVPFTLDQFYLPRSLRYHCPTQSLYVLDESQSALYNFATNLGVQYRLFN